ncbi:hypothetical protein EYF80_028993 [Liparis tanakae]|uniref:Uncharacterized protein n=1 Tax=Liparis tanakae TaxID=230148 RepID=A0A4Z2H726_9TELE|nr:hypothetical protein EYF80_028993 [Liparis tanakae]
MVVMTVPAKKKAELRSHRLLWAVRFPAGLIPERIADTTCWSWLWLTQACLDRNSSFWVRMARRWALGERKQRVRMARRWALGERKQRVRMARRWALGERKRRDGNPSSSSCLLPAALQRSQASAAFRLRSRFLRIDQSFLKQRSGHQPLCPVTPFGQTNRFPSAVRPKAKDPEQEECFVEA